MTAKIPRLGNRRRTAKIPRLRGDMRRAAAHHEAGHAVIGRVLGMICGHATIVPDPQAGLVAHAYMADPDVTWEAWKRNGRMRDFDCVVHGCIMTLMAGGEAESVCIDTGTPGFEYDIDDCMEMLGRYFGRMSKPTNLDLDRLMYRAPRHLVIRHREKIERVAAALLKRGTLSPKQIDAIVWGE